jgi:hypothetical protein
MRAEAAAAGADKDRHVPPRPPGAAHLLRVRKCHQCFLLRVPPPYHHLLCPAGQEATYRHWGDP